jgi:DNA polymerase-3 subunit epsilon
MRQVVLDTETTGLDPQSGHRIIEIGCLEIVNRRPTQRGFHRYLNPEREVDEAATAVHGFRWEDLMDKPKFADVADEFLEFVCGAEIIIHNAPFDVGFLDAELTRMGRERFRTHCPSVIDSLAEAKTLHPGKRNSLDALCERYGISNAHRSLHGALLDAQLLAEVYLAMTRGQDSLMIDLGNQSAGTGLQIEAVDVSQLIVVAASTEELAAHEAYLDGIEKESKKTALWRAALQAAEPLAA